MTYGISEFVYLLCMVASASCAALLLRSYLRNRTPFLMWSCLCFAGLAVNNILLVVDASVPTIDLAIPRVLSGLLALGFMLYGLVWEMR